MSWQTLPYLVPYMISLVISTGVEQIALAMQNISQATAQGLASTRQAETAAQNLNALASGLTEVVQQYRF